MGRKRLFIISGAIGAIILLALIPLFKGLRASNNGGNQKITKITLCDLDARNLCVVAFGADKTDRMVINLQLPDADYPAFYVNGTNKGISTVYQCTASKSIATTIYCVGTRTPLGEAIDIEVYAVDGDLLMARGTIMISSMVLSTPIDFAFIPQGKIVTPTPSPTATIQILPTPTVIFTPTPGVGYPNP